VRTTKNQWERKEVEMRKSLYLSAMLLVGASNVSAQLAAPLNVEVVIGGEAVLPLNGDSDNVEFDGVAVAPDESSIYVFDSVSSYDGIFETASGAAVFATESQLTFGGTSASAGDMDADSSNLYVSVFDGNKQRISRIPHTGSSGAVEMVDSSGVGSVNIDEVSVDTKNSRLIMSYNDAFGAAAEDLVYMPLNATNAVPTVLVTESQIEAVLSGINGYVDDAADDLNMFDIAVQSDGDVILSHGFSSNRQINGSLLRVTETGSISVFRSADQIIQSAGDPASVDIGSVNIVALSDDQILIHVQFSSNNNLLEPFIAVVSADGTTQVKIATQSELASDPDAAAIVPSGQTLFRMDGKSGDVAADDDYYFYRQSSFNGTASQSAVLRLTGIRALLDSSSVEGWHLY
jgi:hypothetical protein